MTSVIPVDYDYFKEFSNKQGFGNDVYDEWRNRAYKNVSEISPGTKIIHNGKVLTFKSYEMDMDSLKYEENYTYDSHYDYDRAECKIKVYVEENKKPFIQTNSENYMKWGWDLKDRYLKFKDLADCTTLRLYTKEDELNTLRKNISKKIKNFNLAELQKLESFIAEIEEK